MSTRRRRWKEHVAPAWLRKAKARLERPGLYGILADRALLEQATQSYLRLAATLREIAKQLTTDEGDRKATEEHFGLGIDEIIQLAHDEMISRAREALNFR